MKIHFRKFIFTSFLYTAFLFSLNNPLWADSTNLSTFYPAPYGDYESLLLSPQNSVSNPCKIGAITVESPDIVRYCLDDGSGNGTGSWGYLSNIWTANSGTTSLYPNQTATNSNLKIGIGTSGPQAEIHIHDQSMPSINWGSITTALGGYPLNANLLITNPNAAFNFIGDDTSSAQAVIQFSELASSGNYQNQWAFWRNTSSFFNLLTLSYIQSPSSTTDCFITSAGYWFACSHTTIFDPSGQIGIGTYKTATDIILEAELHLNNIKGPDTSLRLEETSGTDAIWDFKALDNIPAPLTDGFAIYGGASGSLNNRLTINSAGNVGIGVTGTTPLSAQLQINNGGIQLENTNTNLEFVDTTLLQNDFNIFNLTGNLLFGTDIDLDGSYTDDLLMSIAGSTGNIIFQPTADTDIPAYNLHIKGSSIGIEGLAVNIQPGLLFLDTDSYDWKATADYVGGKIQLIFQDSNGGAFTNRLILQDNGSGSQIYMGIGTTGTVSYPLHVPIGGSAARIESDGDVCSSANTCLNDDYGPSDYKLKKDITPLKGALNKLLKLKGIEFYWKTPEDHSNKKDKQIGWIAQDVEKIFPEWISHNGLEHKIVHPKGFESLTVKSIQEIYSTLESRNTNLTEKLLTLEESINDQEKIFKQQNKLLNKQEKLIQSFRDLDDAAK